MFYMIAAILIALWVLGLVSGYMMGGFLHLLLVMAIVIVIISITPVRRRRP